MTGRALVALVGKELHHHTASMVGLTALMAALLTVSLAAGLATQSNTLLTAASGFVYYCLPLGVLFLVRRLVVLEHEQSTWDFLAALPVAAWVRVTVKYLLGLGWCLAVAEAAVVLIAVLVHRHELITVGWVAQVGWQCAAYTFAWFGITFGIAHLGRFRFATWLALFAVVVSSEDYFPDIYTWGTWHAVLGEPVDATRQVAPYDALPITLAWGLAGTALGYALGTLRAGAVAHEWFRPMSGRERSSVFVATFALFICLDAADALVEPGGPAYRELPSEGNARVQVRTIAPDGSTVRDAAIEVARALDTLGAVLHVEHWPDVVLLADPQATVPAEQRDFAHDELVLIVDPELDRDTLVRAALDHVLVAPLAGAPLYRGDRWWVVLGASAWWTGQDPVVLERRCAVAAQAGVTADDLADTHALEARVGRDVAVGVAFCGLRALESREGRGAVEALLARVLGRRPPRNLAGFAWWDGVTANPLAGLGIDPEAFRIAWLAALATSEPGEDVSIPAWGEVRRIREEGAEVALRVTWDEPPPPGTEVRWSAVDALQGLPQPEARRFEQTLRERETVVPTVLDPRARVAVRQCVYLDALEGDVCSPLQVLP